MANTNETYAARIQRKLMKKQYLVEVATGRRKADLVLKNASYVNVFSNELCHGDIAVAKGQIVGMGDYAGEVEYDVSGKIVCPGFIDAHIHLESSLVSPREFVRAVLPHGTTTVITDPHEITNVMGTDGIDLVAGVTTFNEVYTVSKAMCNAAREVILMADSSKFGRKSPNIVCGLERVDKLITDADIDPEFQRALEAKGIEVIITGEHHE